MIQKLNEFSLREATHWLVQRDTRLARVFNQFGYPPLWQRNEGFSTLIHIILEQQVSLASANAAFFRLQQNLKIIQPDNFLTLGDTTLREIGFSRQKINYARGIAHAVVNGEFSFESLSEYPDEVVRSHMIALKGVGHWTIDIYLSECLMRTDILPQGDIAMQEAFRVLTGMDRRPNHNEFVELTQHWRPWRSVGTRLLWHFYLNEKKNKK